MLVGSQMKLLIILLPLSMFCQSKQQVFNYCIRIGIKHPEIVTAQSVLETGNYQCKNCSLDKNNIFGFYYKKKYIAFDSWHESVDYYKRWQVKRYDTRKNYFEFLKCVRKRTNGECMPYAQSEDYIDKLKMIKL